MAESHREEIAKLESLYAGNPGGRVFVHLAEAYRKAGEHERARRILEEGLARHTDSASGYVVLGRVLADMQINAEAEQAFRRVLELDGGNLVALRWLGDLARQSGRLGEALGHYRELLVRNPSNEEVRELVEIVEREAGGAAVPPPEAGPELVVETGSAVADEEAAAEETPAQAGALEPEDVTPWSAAPGQTADAGESPVEFGLVEISAEPPSEPAPPPSFEPEVDVVARFGEAEAGPEPDATAGEDEAEPVELHLLDPAWEGGEETPDDEMMGEIDLSDLETLEEEPPPPDQMTDVTLDLSEFAGEEEPEGEYADASFLADLISTPVETAPDTAAGTVDLTAEDTSLTLLGGDEVVETSDDSSEPPVVISDTSLTELAGAAEPAAEEAAEDTAPAWMFAEEPSSEAEAEVEEIELVAEEVVAEEPEPEAEAAPVDMVSEAAPPPAEEPEAVAPEAAAEPAAPEPAHETSPPAAPAEPRPARAETGLMTETMALLYRSQGFHDRAAEVYRALLRNRPDDERLRARLREAEEAAAAAAAPAPPAEEVAGEVWLRGVGAPWNAGEVEPPVDATPYAWTEPEEADQSEAIGSYLRDLVSWKPRTHRSEPAVAATTRPEQPQPRASEPPPPAADRWSEAAIEELSSWEPAPEPTPEPERAADESADPWFQEPAAEAGSPAEDQGGWTPLELEADMEVAPDQVPANTSPPPPSRMDAEEDEEDEDLEMFRSWLQSLKK